MDPQEALRQLAGLATRWDHVDPGRTPEDRTADIDRTVELFTGIDEWITRGGFVPFDWANASTTIDGQGNLTDTLWEIRALVERWLGGSVSRPASFHLELLERLEHLDRGLRSGWSLPSQWLAVRVRVA